jgi:site-specific recombinase XerD
MPSRSLSSLLSTYLIHRLVRPATVTCFNDAIRNLERFGEATGTSVGTLAEIDARALLSHRKWCLENTRPASYNKHRRHLRALLNFAVAEGIMATSPLAKVSSAPLGQRRPKVVPANWYSRTLQLLEREALIGLRPTNFWRIAFSVIHFTGMRRRQLVEMQWQHVLWSRSAILLSTEGSKSHREWLVPIPKWVTAELKALHGRAGQELGVAPAHDHQVFCLPLHSPNKKFVHQRMNVEHVSKAFDSLSGYLGYKVSSHRVRHTSATIMLDRSRNLKAVSDMLGHSDIKLTASTYIHPTMGALRRVQKVMPRYSQD